MPIDVADLRPTIIPKSDQLNAEQLLGGPMTIRVTDVRIGSSDEQPISVHYEGEGGRPYKPCKTMRKVLILGWGPDGREWVGRRMTLYQDPRVKFGGAEVGGVRISHMSDIPKRIVASLTATKGKKAVHEIEPLQAEEEAPHGMSESKLQEWRDAISIASADELEDIAKQAIKAARDAGDRVAYDALKACAVRRREKLQGDAP